jgi:hypothetical protein
VNTVEVINAPAGGIFARLIDIANIQEATILRKGDIWTGGIQRQETISPAPLAVDLRRIVERSGEEYDWRPVADFNGLAIYCDWFRALGEYVQVELNESPRGGNIEKPTMYEDGNIINNVFGYGDGMTWQTRPQATNLNTDSIYDYGLRQISKQWIGVKELSTVSNNNQTVINQQRNPVRTFDVNAINVGETFQYLKLGNSMWMNLASIGFGGLQTKVRIMGMSYNPVEGQKIRLVLREIV